VLEWIATYRINEYSDFLGLIVTVVGFALTLWNVWKSRSIATQALLVANKVRDDLRKVEIVAEFSTAVAAMEEIKRLHRKGEIDALPERYSALRRSLITMRDATILLSNEDQTLLQGAISQFAGFERKIEKALVSDSTAKIDFAKMNRVVSTLVDEIHAVVVRMKTAIGDGQ
jgi:hypothetical protein